MSELEQKKHQAVETLLSLCPRCQRHEEHFCPVAKLSQEVKSLRAIPVNVNDRLYSIVFMS